tara:strand:+ start:4770 stop:4928 length:159 start_codon:yes stop_codon:yes gene_type:complete
LRSQKNEPLSAKVLSLEQKKSNSNEDQKKKTQKWKFEKKRKENCGEGSFASF